MLFTIATFFLAPSVLAALVPRHYHAGERNGTAVPITKHLQLLNADQTVDLNAVNQHVISIQSKILRGYDNFERKTGTPHPSAPKGLWKRGNTMSVAYDNKVYYGMIGVGTPDFAYDVQFDTASADLFIPSYQCDSTCDSRWPYRPSSSSTENDSGQTFDIDYGNGVTASGEIYTDYVTVGDFAVTGQTFGAASTYGPGLQTPGFVPDGVMGMGFDSISNLFGASTLFQSLVSQGQVSESVFSFKLAHSGGELWLGGENPALYTGTFSYAAVDPPGYWEVIMDEVRINDKTILTSVDCVIDTAAYLIMGTSSDVSQLHSAYNGQPAPSSYGNGYYTFKCDSFPVIYFVFGGSAFPIPASELNLGPLSPNSPDCVSGIVALPSGGAWIIGDVFLRNVYTKFDVGNTRVGFARLA